MASGTLFAPGKRTSTVTTVFFAVAVAYSMIVTVTAFVVFGGFPPDFTNPLADFVAPLALRGCVAPNMASEMGLGAWVGFVLIEAGLAYLIYWTYKVLPLQKPYKYAAAIVALVAITCAFSIRGDNPPKEDRAYRWVYGDILRCSNDKPRDQGK